MQFFSGKNLKLKPKLKKLGKTSDLSRFYAIFVNFLFDLLAEKVEKVQQREN